MAITARRIIIKNQSQPQEEPSAELKIENAAVPLEDGTVIHNGQPKKFNKKMSAYMIDMLTTED